MLNDLFTENFSAYRDTATMDRVKGHLIESLDYFDPNQVVFIALQGSQNYNLQTPNSDVDTKLVVVPSLDNLIFNRKPVSTTHVRRNNEHTDWKDIRLMFNTFRKQNLNFIEILYSPWVLVNNNYKEELIPLFEDRDKIGFYCPVKAVQTMRGIALNKYDAIEKDTPAHKEDLEKFGYSPKELHHLIRIYYFMKNYINGEAYEDCLVPSSDIAEWLIEIKQGNYKLNTARRLADQYRAKIITMSDCYLKDNCVAIFPKGDELLNMVQENVMKKAIKMELAK